MNNGWTVSKRLRFSSLLSLGRKAVLLSSCGPTWWRVWKNQGLAKMIEPEFQNGTEKKWSWDQGWPLHMLQNHHQERGDHIPCPQASNTRAWVGAGTGDPVSSWQNLSFNHYPQKERKGKRKRKRNRMSRQYQMLSKTQRDGIIHMSLVGLARGRVTLENSWQLLLKLNRQFQYRPAIALLAIHQEDACSHPSL